MLNAESEVKYVGRVHCASSSYHLQNAVIILDAVNERKMETGYSVAQSSDL
jgi:hypothetical protein